MTNNENTYVALGITRKYKALKAVELYRAYQTTKAQYTMGFTQSRQDNLNATFKAFQDYMEANEELFDYVDAIKRQAARAQ